MTLLKPAELAELKKLAGADLDAALMAAVRLGATRSLDAAKPIKRAAAMLEYEAECIRESCTVNGKWTGESESKNDYDEFKRVAKALRDLLAPEEGK